MEPSLGLYDDLELWDAGRGGRHKRKEVCVPMCIHICVYTYVFPAIATGEKTSLECGELGGNSRDEGPEKGGPLVCVQLNTV